MWASASRADCQRVTRGVPAHATSHGDSWKCANCWLAHAVYGRINERLQDDANHKGRVYYKNDKMAEKIASANRGIDEAVRFFSHVTDGLRGAHYRMKKTVTCRAW